MSVPKFLLGAFLAITLTACSSSRELHNPSTTAELEDLNRAADGKAVSILFEDGTSMNGRDLLAHSDSVEWDSDSGAPKHFVAPTETVLRVGIRPVNVAHRFFSAALTGGGFGLLTGLYAVTEGAETSPSFKDGIEFIGILTGLGLAGGGVYGLFEGVISLIAGSSDDFYLRPKDEVKAMLKPTGP